jgi:hypothetical protein
MKRNVEILVVMLLTMVVASIVMAAPKGLSPVEAETLLKGNTVEGTNKWKKTYHWYFSEDGVIKMKDNLGNKGKAKWSIDKKGYFCFQDKHMNSPKCAPIIPQANGGYDVPLES